MTILRTKRTAIERITIDDAPFFRSLVNTPGWLRHIGDRNVSSVDDARRFLQDGFLKSYRDNGFGYYLVKDLTRVPMGICGFLKKAHLDHPDFGFAWLPEYCGNGLALESSRAILSYGSEEFELDVLDAVVSPTNERSIKLLMKLGFLRQGCIEEPSSG